MWILVQCIQDNVLDAPFLCPKLVDFNMENAAHVCLSPHMTTHFADELFELNVLTDQLIELYHPSSGTFYEFTGRGYIQYLRSEDGSFDKTKKSGDKLRKQKTEKKNNPRENTRK